METAPPDRRIAASPRPPACAQPCPMCGSTEQPVYVHGHSQCATCRINIDPCCGGAPLDGLEAA